MFDAKNVVLTDGWIYEGLVTPCFPHIPCYMWSHDEGWRGHLQQWKVEKGDYSIAIFDGYEIVGFSTTLP
jgi:hypothetical protein